MRLRFLRSLEDSQHHHYWRAHAFCMSQNIPSPLPTDLINRILRLVPTYSYLNVYADPEPAEFDCEMRHDPWSFPDLDEPKAFGDY